jgi:hypothetical protein
VGTPAALPESLNIVALDDILLHEDADAARAEPLVHAMACDGVQRHPVILAHTPEGLLVQLDGANRITALRRLGCQHVVAQVVDYADPAAVHLYTWMHLTCLPLPQKGHGTAVWQALAVEPVPPAHAWLTQTPSANAAVVFALLRKADVITLVVELGMTLPAGLTRHILSCGRVLNVNVPLTLLQANLPAPEKTARLRARLAGQGYRVYAEPTLVYEVE